MSPLLFQQLTTSELNRYASEFDHAIDSHSHWLAMVNRALVCHTPPNADDLSDEAHRRCQFGRWYDSIDDLELSEIAQFQSIARVHEQMHLKAKDLLKKSEAGEVISPADYDQLIELTEQLRHLVNEMRRDFKNNLGLVQKLMGKVFERASEGVMITEPNGTILSVNKAFSEMTGYSPEEVVGKDPSILYSGRQDRAFYRHMWELLSAEGQWQGEIWNRRKNGEIYPEWLSITAIRDDHDQLSYYVAIFSDISNEKENEERLYRLAHYDTLTGLPNRMLFLDRLHQAISRARRNNKQVAVMFLDLDGFKEVNDALGHQAGDQLLCEVAKRLSDLLRESDTIARFGGDEFTIVIPDIEDPEAPRRVAQKVNDVVYRPYTLDKHQASITASIGISLYPKDSEEPEELITRADVAMYHSKKHGKNRFSFFSPEMG